MCLTEKQRKQKVQLVNLQSKGLKVESEVALSCAAVVCFAQCTPDSIASVSPLCTLQLTLMTAAGDLYQLWPLLPQKLLVREGLFSELVLHLKDQPGALQQELLE